jgi:hypothetical protein
MLRTRPSSGGGALRGFATRAEQRRAERRGREVRTHARPPRLLLAGPRLQASGAPRRSLRAVQADVKTAPSRFLLQRHLKAPKREYDEATRTQARAPRNNHLP